jgi:hypothetical protein
MRAPAAPAAPAAVGANSNSTPNISQEQDRFEHNREKRFRGNKGYPEIVPCRLKSVNYRISYRLLKLAFLPVEIFGYDGSLNSPAR